VPAKTLENGYYELRVYLQDFSKKTRIETTEEFFLGGKKAENTYNFGSAVLDKNVEENATSNTTGTPSESSREIETTNKEMLDEAAKDLVVSPRKVASTKFSLVDVKSVLADSVTLQVNTHGNYQFVELYARPLNSLEYRFVSLAKNRLGSWFFNFDSNNLPNGKYELIAKTKLGDEGFETEAIEVLVNNVKPNLVNPKPVSKISVQEQSATPKREFIKLEDIDDKTEDIQLIQNEADFLISLNAEKLNEGLKRYSTALQTGDSILINQAVENLKYFRLDLVETTITNEKLANRSDNINFELQQKLKI